VKRGEVYNARLNPVEGSEQAGENRPVIIVTRDAINDNSPVVLAVPCTKFIGQRVYPSQVLVRAPDGGLDVDSIAMAEQVRAIDKRRLGQLRGTLSPQAMIQLERALLIALDLLMPP
jgi:mRNA interferase MazF